MPHLELCMLGCSGGLLLGELRLQVLGGAFGGVELLFQDGDTLLGQPSASVQVRHPLLCLLQPQLPPLRRPFSLNKVIARSIAS
jgi:hypothetical protein